VPRRLAAWYGKTRPMRAEALATGNADTWN
jgi:hypothetical protein